MPKVLVRYIHIVIPLFLLIAVVFVRVSTPDVIEAIQLKIFDVFQDIKPRVFEDTPVIIVDLDDESLTKLGQWPWPRTQVAELLNKLTAAGAAVIALDIVFAEDDRTSPQNILDVWPQTPELESIRTSLEKLPDHDVLLSETMSQSKIITGFGLTNTINDVIPLSKSGFAIAGDDPKSFIPKFRGAVRNLPILEKAAAGNGSINMLSEYDGIIRRIPLVVRLNELFYPALVLEALRVAQGASTHIIKSSGSSGEESFGENTGIVSIKTGKFVIPTDEQGRMWLYDTGFQHSRFFPAWKVFNGDFEETTFFGKIVLIGTSATGLKDIRSTPLNPVTAGVEVHAQLLEQILLGNYLHRPDWAPGAELVYLIVLGLLLIILMSFVGAMWCAVIGCAAVSVALGASWYAFTIEHLLVDPLMPSLATLVIYLASSFINFLRTESEKNEVRNAFSHYMSPALVERLAKNPGQLKLGGESKYMTFLFTDIRGFTTISEGFEAEELTHFINLYLTPMTDIILKRNGTIDKYMGDAIMAFWNAPLDDADHIQNACEAALLMRDHLKIWNEEMQKDASTRGKKLPLIKIGIGVNSGDCCVGNLGSTQRFDYSVLGDDVNLASRLEGLSKNYGTDIIIGQNTKEKIQDFAAIELDLIKVKGKTQPVHIYSLLGRNDLKTQALFQELENKNNAMLNAYRNKKWDEVDQLVKECQNINLLQTELEPYYNLYLDRVLGHRKTPPPVDWDGITVALTK